MENLIAFVPIALIAILAFCGYFLPALIAAQRNHSQADNVFFLNLIFGWMPIAWIACFIWACSGKNN